MILHILFLLGVLALAGFVAFFLFYRM